MSRWQAHSILIAIFGALLLAAQISPAIADPNDPHTQQWSKPSFDYYPRCTDLSLPADKRISECKAFSDEGSLPADVFGAALANLGIAYWEKRDYPLAIKAFSNALIATPNDWRVLANRAGVYRDAQQFDLSLVDFNGAIAMQPAKAILFRGRGELYLDEEKFDLALTDYTQSLALEPKNAKALFLRAYVKQQKGDATGAAADLAAATAIDPDIANKYIISKSAVNDR